MSPRDIDALMKRLRKLKDALKAQHSLPKAQRDEREIAKLKPLIAKVNEWLREKKVTKAPEKKVVKKAEFREAYKQEFGIQEPDQIMKIDDLEMLDKVWPVIAGKNITIDAPKEVKEEIRRRIVEIRKHQKRDGFR